MSSLGDKAYLELCKQFQERSRHAKLAFDTTDIDLCGEEFDESNNYVPHSFHYLWTVGQRSDSELMWAVEEEVLYISNGKILAKDQAEAFTCHIKKCSGRVYLKPDGIAYKVAEHNVDHGSMYNQFVEMQCRNHMREECKSAGASKNIADIYEEALLL